MQERRAPISRAVSLALGLCCAAGSATAEPLGDRIAEFLCYPASVERLALDRAERDRLLAAPPVSGDYRDIQGSEARAWFNVLDDGTARCRTPANSAMTLYFCAPVALEGDHLRKTTPRLCKLP